MKIISPSLSAALLLSLTHVVAQEVPLTPPDAKPGECYARVVLPAVYEDVDEKVLVKEASEKLTVIPAEFTPEEKAVEIIPQTTKLTPVPPVYNKVKETIVVKPSLRVWKTSLHKKALPVGPAILSAAKAFGVDIDHAQAGECFKEYFLPQTFKTVTEEIMVKAESNETKVIPPQFEETEKTVVMKPAYKKIVAVPAVYEKQKEKVLVEPEKTVWKKGENPAQKLSGATGDIMCLVKVPAKYKTLTKRVLKSPATTKTVEVPEETKSIKVKKLIADSHIEHLPVPAKYITVEKQVIDTNATFAWFGSDEDVDKAWKYTGHQICLTETPAKTKEITKVVMAQPEEIQKEAVPATMKRIEVQKLLAEAHVEKTPVEAVYKEVKKHQKRSDSKIVWKRILCQTNMTKETIAKLQQALNDKGYDAGKADGILGRGTREALDRFQRENALATGGITYETLNALGVKL